MDEEKKKKKENRRKGKKKKDFESEYVRKRMKKNVSGKTKKNAIASSSFVLANTHFQMYQ